MCPRFSHAPIVADTLVSLSVKSDTHRTYVRARVCPYSHGDCDSASFITQAPASEACSVHVIHVDVAAAFALYPIISLYCCSNLADPYCHRRHSCVELRVRSVYFEYSVDGHAFTVRLTSLSPSAIGSMR